MKGLLVKDFLCIKQQAKILFMLLLFFAAFSIIAKGGAMMAVTGLTLAAALVIIMNTFAFDDGAKWDIYAFSLPVRKKQIVFEKYIFTLIMTVAASLLSGIFCAVSQ